jgi:hypothetical protein
MCVDIVLVLEVAALRWVRLGDVDRHKISHLGEILAHTAESLCRKRIMNKKTDMREREAEEWSVCLCLWICPNKKLQIAHGTLINLESTA